MVSGTGGGKGGPFTGQDYLVAEISSIRAQLCSQRQYTAMIITGSEEFYTVGRLTRVAGRLNIHNLAILMPTEPKFRLQAVVVQVRV